MIDVNKKYTCNGKRVVNLKIVEKNSVGNRVTYPVKGTVILSEKPLKTDYQIWSIDGKVNVVWDNPKMNLVECN